MRDPSPNLEIPGDLEIPSNLASADDLEIAHKQNINNPQSG